MLLAIASNGVNMQLFGVQAPMVMLLLFGLHIKLPLLLQIAVLVVKLAGLE
jgi:hypothetical protein